MKFDEKVRSLVSLTLAGIFMLPVFPAPAGTFHLDCKGDWTTRVGIFRPSNGFWAINGVTRVYFGSANDTPVSRYRKINNLFYFNSGN